MEDITIRAQKILASVDLVLCEDTRRTARLTNTKLMRFDEHMEQKLVPEVLALLSDKNIALVSDAGTPLISDPGYRLIHEAIKHGIKVVSIPGPTAAVAALSVSGLPTNHFMFLGYPPEKQSHRLKLFGALPKDVTIILYCAPHKLQQTLTDMQTALGDIPIVIGRELTKIHEEVWRGKLSESLQKFEDPMGEFVILLTL